MIDRRKFIKVGAAAIALGFAGGLEKILPAPDALTTFEQIEAQIYAAQYPELYQQEMMRMISVHYQVPEYMLYGKGRGEE